MPVRIPVKYQKWLSLKEAAARMNLKYSQYVRRLVKEKKLRAVKLDLGSRTKWLVDPDSCDAYVARTSGGFATGPVSRRVLRFNNTVFTDDQIRAGLVEQFGPDSLEDGSFRWSYHKPVQKKARAKAGVEPGEDWTAKILEMYAPGDAEDDDSEEDDALA